MASVAGEGIGQHADFSWAKLVQARLQPLRCSYEEIRRRPMCSRNSPEGSDARLVAALATDPSRQAGLRSLE
eukprot:scaffold5924_cov44-Prasinocladus_malaysianus.AAC.1